MVADGRTLEAALLVHLLLLVRLQALIVFYSRQEEKAKSPTSQGFHLYESKILKFIHRYIESSKRLKTLFLVKRKNLLFSTTSILFIQLKEYKCVKRDECL